MTLLFADGLEAGSAAFTLSNMSIGTGRFGNGLVSTGASGAATLGIGVLPITSIVIVGCAFKSVGAGVLFSVQSPSGAVNCQVYRGASGEIVIYRTNNTNILGSSAANILPITAWSYVEAKILCHDTLGTVNVRVSGVEVLNLTNVDNKAGGDATIDKVVFGGTSGGTGTIGNSFDDIYVCDNTGSVNNDFLGELMVEHLVPGSNDTSQWVGSDGNSVDNWDLVNEIGAANTADYVATSTVGHRDLYVPVSSSRPISSPVRGVIVSATAQKTDAGTRTAKLMIKEGAGGTERQSAELGLPTSFGELRALWDRKADGSAWTVADVNQLRFGIEVVS